MRHTAPWCGLVAIAMLYAATSLCQAAQPKLVWGVNGHPLVSYPDITFEEQIGLIKSLGATSYRVDVANKAQTEPLSRLVTIARNAGIEILPVLIPPVDLEKDDVGTIYHVARSFAEHFVSRFRSTIRVYELGNELENFAILRPCEIQDDGKQYNCSFGPAGGVTPLEYHGGRWKKVSAVLKGLSDGAAAVNPLARRAIGTAGWGHIGAFERMRADGIDWDISVPDYPDISARVRTAAISWRGRGFARAPARASLSTFFARSKRRLKRHS